MLSPLKSEEKGKLFYGWVIVAALFVVGTSLWGIRLSFGCDVPATPLIDPKWALIGATARMTFDMTPMRTEESISMKDALRSHTIESAYAAFEENIRGSIEPGKTADMVVWSEDLYSASIQQLATMRIEGTIVEGKVVYKAADTSIAF